MHLQFLRFGAFVRCFSFNMIRFFVVTLLLVSIRANDVVPEDIHSLNTVEDAAEELINDAKEPFDDIRAITAINATTSVRCPHHEVFIDCPDAHTCQQTCATLNHACVITPECTPGCFCRTGFARDINNRCVPISDCPGTLTAKGSE